MIWLRSYLYLRANSVCLRFMQMGDKTLIQQVAYTGVPKPALRRLATERMEGDAYPVF
jgi:hypothetical protein